MSNIVATAAALRTALSAFTALPLYWPNDPRDPPLDGFVYSEIRVTDEKPVTIGVNGTRKHRDTGEFAVYIYVPAGSLAGAAEQHAETIRALFGVTDIPGVVVTRRTIGQGQIVDGPNGRNWAVPVIVEWFSDRTE